MKKYFIFIGSLFALSGVALLILFIQTDLRERGSSPSDVVDVLDTERLYLFDAAPDMREPRSHATSAAVDERIYLIGGVDPSGEVLDVVEMYDAERDHWSIGPALPEPRRNAAAAAVGGVIYVFGGQDAHGNYERTVWALDETADAWRSVRSMDSPRARHAVIVSGDEVYVFGGSAEDELPLSVDVFHVATNNWETVSEMPGERYGFVAGEIDGKMYLAGGSRILNNPRTDVDIFDPKTGEWSKGLPIPTPRLNPAGVAIDDALVIAGGDDGALSFASIDIYDPVKGYWIGGVELPTERTDMTAAVFEDEIYFLGGGTRQGPARTDAAIVLFSLR